MLFQTHLLTPHSSHVLTKVADLCVKLLFFLVLINTCYGRSHLTKNYAAWRPPSIFPARNVFKPVAPSHRQLWAPSKRTDRFDQNSLSENYNGDKNIKSIENTSTNACDTANWFLNKIEGLILSGIQNDNLRYFQKYWRTKLESCRFKKQIRKSNVEIERVEFNSVSAEPNNNNALFVWTGISGIITTFIWLYLVATQKHSKVKHKHKSPERRKMTLRIHIYPPSEEESAEEHKEKSEESDKKKAAVGVGLAREILAINAESIHLSAHILEFLFILTKLARVVGRLGIPAPAVRPGQLLTPTQAHEFLQTLEKNYNTSKILSNISSSGFKNPLSFLGNNISGSTIFNNALSNPAASLALKKLLEPYNKQGNSTQSIPPITKITNNIFPKKNSIFGGKR